MANASTSQRIIDRSYALHEPLGHGGMGTVFRATQLTSGQDVALKIVGGQRRSSTSSSDAVSHRLALTHEFQTLASLQHENVIRVLSYGFDESLGPYYTMELLRDPQDIVEAGRSRTDPEKIELIAQLLRALVYLHARGVLHRDIKPGDGAVSCSRRKRGYADGLRTCCGLLCWCALAVLNLLGVA